MLNLQAKTACLAKILPLIHWISRALVVKYYWLRIWYIEWHIFVFIILLSSLTATTKWHYGIKIAFYFSDLIKSQQIPVRLSGYRLYFTENALSLRKCCKFFILMLKFCLHILCYLNPFSKWFPTEVKAIIRRQVFRFFSETAYVQMLQPRWGRMDLSLRWHNGYYCTALRSLPVIYWGSTCRPS